MEYIHKSYMYVSLGIVYYTYIWNRNIWKSVYRMEDEPSK